MLDRLQQRWKLSFFNFILVVTTFALGGILCGMLGKKVLATLSISNGALWLGSYLILITLLWPLCVLSVSAPLGQFSFFKQYLTKLWNRILGKKTGTLPQIAIFASGAGSNAKKIIEHFEANPNIAQVALVVCNKADAGVLPIAAEHQIEQLLIEKEAFFKSDVYIKELQQRGIDFIVLAGFLWKIPVALIQAFPNKIVNIHPALLPKYGGKGMYGQHVHAAVLAAGDKESGITIHYVDELYDHGGTIFQATCVISEEDTAHTIAQKVHVLEHLHYPKVIADLLKMQNPR